MNGKLPLGLEFYEHFENYFLFKELTVYLLRAYIYENKK